MVKKLVPSIITAGFVILVAACGSGSGTPAATPSQSQGTTAPVGATVAATTTPAPTLVAQAATPASNPSTRLTGPVTAVSANMVTLQDGSSFTLNPQTSVTRTLAATAADLKPGQIVAVTAKQQADNSLLASLVRVFPPSTSFKLGQSPDGSNLMTNATVSQVSGSTFTVTFPGGGAQVKLAPDVQITQIVTGTTADVKVGSTVSASVTGGVARSVGIQ